MVPRDPFLAAVCLPPSPRRSLFIQVPQWMLWECRGKCYEAPLPAVSTTGGEKNQQVLTKIQHIVHALAACLWASNEIALAIEVLPNLPTEHRVTDILLKLWFLMHSHVGYHIDHHVGWSKVLKLDVSGQAICYMSEDSDCFILLWKYLKNFHRQ